MKDSVCETTLPSDADTDEDDDLLRREGTGLDQVQVSLAYHVQPPEFAMDPQNISMADVSPTKVKSEGSETGGWVSVNKCSKMKNFVSGNEVIHKNGSCASNGSV